MKKKIGIVTIGDYNNYGNRLQNFALYYILSKKLHNKAYTIINFKNFQDPFHQRNRISQFVHGLVRYHLFYFQMEKKFRSRIKNFKLFSKEWTEEYIPANAKNRNDVDFDNFDKIVLGSDQVWNFDWINLNQVHYFMLSGVPKAKRIGYAVSMGNPPVKKKYLSIFKREIHNFNRLSVREEATQFYLKSEFNVNPELVLDPTLLLSQKEWKSALKLKQIRNEPFILTYFLSEPSYKMRTLLKEVSRKKRLKVINLFNTNKNDLRYFDMDPRMMLEYILSADCVLTDSFHGSVFASIFHIPFVVDNDREGGGMSSRIITLLNTLGLKKRILNSDYNIDTLYSASFSNIDDTLQMAKNYSLHFLNEALESE